MTVALNGKAYYTEEEICSLSGYKQGTVRILLTSHEGHLKMDDGSHFYSDSALQYLKEHRSEVERKNNERKRQKDEHIQAPAPTQAEEPPKDICTDKNGVTRGHVRILNQKQMKIWEEVKRIAGDNGIPPSDLIFRLLEKGLESDMVRQLSKLHEEKRKLLGN